MTKYIDQERARYWPVSKKLMAEYCDGTHTIQNTYHVCWRNQECQYHRDGDKPAFIDADGSLQWLQNNKLHRDGDKPAIIDRDGTLEWWQNGKQHRSRGPALIYASGTLEWWINGEEITQEVRKWLNGKKWVGTPEQIFEFQLRFG